MTNPSPLVAALAQAVVEQRDKRTGCVPVVGAMSASEAVCVLASAVDDTCRPRREAMTCRLAWSEHEAAEALGVGERTLRAWRDRGIVPYKRIGGVVLYSPDALRDWMRETYDDHKEDEHGKSAERTPRASPTRGRPVASRAAAGSRKPGASKPRLPVGLISGRGSA